MGIPGATAALLLLAALAGVAAAFGDSERLIVPPVVVPPAYAGVVTQNRLRQGTVVHATGGPGAANETFLTLQSYNTLPDNPTSFTGNVKTNWLLCVVRFFGPAASGLAETGLFLLLAFDPCTVAAVAEDGRSAVVVTHNASDHCLLTAFARTTNSSNWERDAVLDGVRLDADASSSSSSSSECPHAAARLDDAVVLLHAHRVTVFNASTCHNARANDPLGECCAAYTQFEPTDPLINARAAVTAADSAPILTVFSPLSAADTAAAMAEGRTMDALGSMVATVLVAAFLDPAWTSGYNATLDAAWRAIPGADSPLGVSFTQYCAATVAASTSAGASSRTFTQALAEFVAADADGDGRLTEAEFRAHRLCTYHALVLKESSREVPVALAASDAPELGGLVTSRGVALVYNCPPAACAQVFLDVHVFSGILPLASSDPSWIGSAGPIQVYTRFWTSLPVFTFPHTPTGVCSWNKMAAAILYAPVGPVYANLFLCLDMLSLHLVADAMLGGTQWAGSELLATGHNRLALPAPDVSTGAIGIGHDGLRIVVPLRDSSALVLFYRRCPMGHTPTSTGACAPCPAGTAPASYEVGVPGVVGGALMDCMPCPAGSYSSVVGASNPAACLSCPVGTFRELTGGASLSDCVSCLPGTRSMGVSNSQWRASCQPCPAGTYSPGGAASTCSVCYNPNGCLPLSASDAAPVGMTSSENARVYPTPISDSEAPASVSALIAFAAMLGLGVLILLSTCPSPVSRRRGSLTMGLTLQPLSGPDAAAENQEDEDEDEAEDEGQARQRRSVRDRWRDAVAAACVAVVPQPTPAAIATDPSGPDYYQRMDDAPRQRSAAVSLTGDLLWLTLAVATVVSLATLHVSLYATGNTVIESLPSQYYDRSAYVDALAPSILGQATAPLAVDIALVGFYGECVAGGATASGPCVGGVSVALSGNATCADWSLPLQTQCEARADGCHLSAVLGFPASSAAGAAVGSDPALTTSLTLLVTFNQTFAFARQINVIVGSGAANATDGSNATALLGVLPELSASPAASSALRNVHYEQIHSTDMSTSIFAGMARCSELEFLLTPSFVVLPDPNAGMLSLAAPSRQTTHNVSALSLAAGRTVALSRMAAGSQADYRQVSPDFGESPAVGVCVALRFDHPSHFNVWLANPRYSVQSLLLSIAAGMGGIMGFFKALRGVQTSGWWRRRTAAS